MEPLTDKQWKAILASYRSEAIADEGFTRRVMSRLPSRERSYQWVVWLCGLVGLIPLLYSGIRMDFWMRLDVLIKDASLRFVREVHALVYVDYMQLPYWGLLYICICGSILWLLFRGERLFGRLL